jgi:DNA-binding transcriptional regulator LsrR (DeoR family)
VSLTITGEAKTIEARVAMGDKTPNRAQDELSGLLGTAWQALRGQGDLARARSLFDRAARLAEAHGDAQARIGGGTAHVFYAPMILDDAETAAAIRRQADVADALALVSSVTIAMVAIGAWAPALSTIYDAGSPAERADIARLGVIAEMAGVFPGKHGRPVPTGLDSRMIVTPGHVLAKIPSVIAVAYGVSKSAAVHAAIRGGMIHGLVTHTSMARALLSKA